MDDDTPKRRRTPLALTVSLISGIVVLATAVVGGLLWLLARQPLDLDADRTRPPPPDDDGDGGGGGTADADQPDANDAATADGAEGDGSQVDADGCDEDVTCDDSGCDSATCEAPTCEIGGCDTASAASIGGDVRGCGLADTCGNAIDETCASIARNTCSTDNMACDSSLNLGSVASTGVSVMSVLPLATVDRLAPRWPIRRRSVVSVPARCGLVAIRGYRRFVSPRTRTRCRYRPSCSSYGATTIARFGLANGSRLALRRIRRCTATVPMGTVDPPP